MKKWLLLISCTLLFGVLLSACSNTEEGSSNNAENSKPEEDFSYDVEEFEYKNQNGEMVSSEDLKGTYWVAAFIFTNCTAACPPMTANMAKIQSQLKEAGLEDNIRFVSFSIDPNHDSPKVLKEFANKFDADFSNWDLLTGYSQKEIKEFSVKSFKSLVERIPVQDPAEGQADYNYMHSSSLFLVSPDGRAIKKYNGTDYSKVDGTVKSIKEFIE